ncbi:50S ribosomal protein L28, putative [Eimeria brunetti]|uniref:Large ribosomal subunit protein bL28c n=1 Tax=Eimeria brunetti TaxID=51314 RepID=U6LVT7_9EIME|nr:50S ribosomal protein L28, putative [Eimeria brunetti]
MALQRRCSSSSSSSAAKTPLLLSQQDPSPPVSPAFVSFWGQPLQQQMLGPAGLQMNEKRYKEQLMGKKFTSVGRSSIARHYRIQGRGGGKPRVRKATGLPSNPIVLPARRCMLLGKMDNRKARSISHSGVRTHRVQKLNLRWKRLWWAEAGHYVRLRLSMKGLKTIKKYGLQRAANKFKLNLNDKRLFAGYSHRRKYRNTPLDGALLGAQQQGGGPSAAAAAAAKAAAAAPPAAAAPSAAAAFTPASFALG